MNDKLPPLEQGIKLALNALTNQIEREIQRTPEERAKHGVLKNAPLLKRIERVCTLVVDETGSNGNTMDGVLVLAQALSKSLEILASELGSDGLGKVRTSYFLQAADALEKSANDIKIALRAPEEFLV